MLKFTHQYIFIHSFLLLSSFTMTYLDPETMDLILPEIRDISFDEFLQEALMYPCPCEDCLNDLCFDTPEKAQHYLNDLLEVWEMLTSQFDGYDAPPTSPTNQEMHAINGNIETPFIKDVTDVLEGFRDAYNELPIILEQLRGRGKYSSDEAMHHYRKHFANHPSGRFFDAGTPEYEEWLSIFEKTLKPAQLNNSKKISNKEQHAKNGNLQPQITPIWEWNPQHEDQKNIDPVDPTQDLYEHLLAGQNPATISVSTGPTNQEMHAYNGNNNPMAAAKAALNRLNHNKKKSPPKKKPVNKQKKYQPKITKNINIRKNQKLPRNVKAAGKVEAREEAIARKYLTFLKTPTFAPPRIGSSGSVPTKLVHGMWKTSYNMSSITWGAITVSNATCITAAINPQMFSTFVSVSDFAAPILLCATTDSANKPSLASSAGNFAVFPFANDLNLQLEVIGTNTASKGNPLARYLGGAITLDCRCPMTTTAPPTMFGGSLRYPTAGTENINKDKQINVIAPASLRALPESCDITGFSVSSVYAPASNQNLEFNATTCMREATVQQRSSPVPYVGCVNCPTSAIVTVTVTGWFEVQPFINNDGLDTSFYSGWVLGPKISTEDIYDHIREFKTVSSKIINQGAKSNLAHGYEAAVMHDQPIKPTVSLVQQIEDLSKMYKELKLQIDAEEDEKYFDVDVTPSLDQEEIPEPLYKGLSKSTIDLAINLKKSLTPGSVTNKTIQNSLQ